MSEKDIWLKILTQLTTGGNNEADIATPINGPDAPKSSANATPEPEVSAHATPIHNERAFPLQNQINSKVRISSTNKNSKLH